MKALLRSREIKLLKRQVKDLYQESKSIADGYSCGHELLKHMSVTYSDLCIALNVRLDALAAIDPTCPTKRF